MKGKKETLGKKEVIKRKKIYIYNIQISPNTKQLHSEVGTGIHTWTYLVKFQNSHIKRKP